MMITGVTVMWCSPTPTQERGKKHESIFIFQVHTQFYQFQSGHNFSFCATLTSECWECRRNGGCRFCCCCCCRCQQCSHCQNIVCSWVCTVRLWDCAAAARDAADWNYSVSNQCRFASHPERTHLRVEFVPELFSTPVACFSVCFYSTLSHCYLSLFSFALFTWRETQLKVLVASSVSTCCPFFSIFFTSRFYLPFFFANNSKAKPLQQLQLRRWCVVVNIEWKPRRRRNSCVL